VHSDVVLWIVVGTALAFDFTNGFHDTANAIATSVSTRALSPRVAVAMSASLNFVGAFLSLAVAATIAKGIVDSTSITLLTVFAGLIGAIAWNLTTWWFGLPSSSSHALIGGMVGATLVAQGPSAVLWEGLVDKVAVPALVAPILALVAAGSGILIAYRIIGRQSPGVVSRGFRLGQLATSSLFSLSHGTNDAQKTMGIIFLALVANGNLDAGADIPNWVVVSSATGTPVPALNVSDGGSSISTAAPGPDPLRSAASASTTAGESATAVVLARRRWRRRSHAARRTREATSPGGGARLGIAAGPIPAKAGAATASRNQSISDSSHTSPRRQVIDPLRSQRRRRLLPGAPRSGSYDVALPIS